MLQEDKKCFILNKAFEGKWNEKDGNISHEIIDFFLADDDNYYVYNSPFGSCEQTIYVSDDDCYKYGGKKDKHKAEYLIIVSQAQIDKENGSSSFVLKYLIEVEKRLHKYCANGK